MPKKSAGAIPHHKSQMIGEALLTVINTMPKTAPMGPSTYFRMLSIDDCFQIYYIKF